MTAAEAMEQLKEALKENPESVQEAIESSKKAFMEDVEAMSRILSWLSKLKRINAELGDSGSSSLEDAVDRMILTSFSDTLIHEVARRETNEIDLEVDSPSGKVKFTIAVHNIDEKEKV